MPSCMQPGHWSELATALLLAGCAAGASPTAGPATPAPAVTPAPSATPGRTLVSGILSCRLNYPETAETPAPTPAAETPTPVPNQVYHWEHFDLVCEYAMSDPRLSGTERYVSAAVALELPGIGGANLWDDGAVVLTAQGGTWEGRAVGTDFEDNGRLRTFGYNVYEGRGAFAGLAATLWFYSDSGTMGMGAPYLVSGWIEPSK